MLQAPVSPKGFADGDRPDARPPEPSPARPPRRAHLAVLSLLALSFMIFQIAVLRELRFQLSTVFTLTPFLFSSVIGFIGLGSLAAARMTRTSRRVLHWSLALLPALMWVAFALMLIVAQATIDHTSVGFSTYGQPHPGSGDDYIRLLVRGVAAVSVFGYGPIFFLQGLVFALYFREGRQDGTLSNVYAADLLASGVGALVAGALSFVLEPRHMVLVASALVLVTLCVSYRHVGTPRRVAVGASLLALGLIVLECAGGVLALLEAPRWLGPAVSYSAWSRYRRIDVVDLPGELGVYSDGLLFHQYRKNDRSHDWDPRAIPARVLAHSDRPVRDVLVVGSGTGSDVRILRDLVSGELNVVAVELDEGFVKAAQAFPWLWDEYRKAEIVVQEGRYFLENDSRTFDAVIYAYIDPQAAISDIGLPDANFLYTDAGLRRAYAKVRPGGHLFITRVFFVREQDEFVRRLSATLREAGVPPDQVRLYRHRDSIAWGYYGELSTIHAVVAKDARPAELDDPRLVPLAWPEGGRATTDFFPISMVTGVWFDVLWRFVVRDPVALLLSTTLAVVLLVRLGSSVGYLSFFLLGFGSFLLESLVLFNSFLLLGDPNLSAAMAVGLFLFWGGLGSLLSERWERSRWLYAAVPLTVLVYAVTAPVLNGQTIAMAPGLRALIFALHLSVSGVVAGAMFPVALRSFRAEGVGAMFFIDVVGCALAPVGFWLAMSAAGIWPVAAGAVGAYAAVAGVLALRS